MHEIITTRVKGLISKASSAAKPVNRIARLQRLKARYGQAQACVANGDDEGNSLAREALLRRNLVLRQILTAGSNTETPSSSNSEPHFKTSNRAVAAQLPGYVRARQAILKTQKYQNWTDRVQLRKSRATRSQEAGFERVLLGPKLQTRADPHWIVYEPYAGHKRQLKTRHFTANDERRALLGYKMKSWVQIITTPTADTPGTTLLLHFDNKRYLVGNLGEGLQRTCVQRRIALLKVEDIFMTGKVDWKSTGGMLGMVLTIADIAATQAEDSKMKAAKAAKAAKAGLDVDPRRLVLHGAENLMHLIATARRFVFRQGTPLQIDEIRERDEDLRRRDFEKPTWTDVNLMVWAMVISPEFTTPPNRRKRSYEEISEDFYSGNETGTIGKVESEAELNDRYDQLRKGVIGHMFDSDWRLDTLRKMKLSAVKMPSAIFMRNTEGRIQKYVGPLPGTGEVVPDIEVLVRTPWPGAMVESLPPAKPSAAALSYIIKNHPQRGKFNVEAATRLGLKPGSQFRELTSGKSVISEAGDVITPEMVLGPGKDGGGFAVVELPSVSYVDGLVNREEWGSKEVMKGVRIIFWILGEGVSQDERLAKFMQDHSDLKHIISSTDTCPDRITMESPATAAVHLNLIDPEHFPVPVHSAETLVGKNSANENVTAARLGETIQLEPTFESQDKTVVSLLNIDKVIEEASPEVLKLAEEARHIIQDPAYIAKLDELQKDLPGKDAEIITLGTGSALPSKYRNVAATLVRVPGHGTYLFDCGENTLGQMKRVFGASLPAVLRDLKSIWISHLHADHHLGTVSVIKAWHSETSSDPALKLIVASDDGMLQFLEEYAEVEDFGHHRITPLAMNAENDFSSNFSPSETAASGLSSIRACPVSHCNGALAVVFAFPTGFRVAYSGDCRPSSEFARLGKGATLLIHEATFDDELIGDAQAKKHCTTSEALGVALEMGARRVVFTHFSQRYQRIPAMGGIGGKNGNEMQVDGTVVVAFDYMRCKVGDLVKLVEFRGALEKLFEEKEDK